MNKSWRMTIATVAMLSLSACGVFKGSRKTPTLGDRVPILVSENAAESDKSIVDVQVLLPPAAANDSWTQPGGSPSKSMGHLALGTTVSRVWTASIPGGSKRERLASAPVIADNRLFVVDVQGGLHAFAADTGAKLWSVPIAVDKKNREARFGGGASYDDGKVFATDGIGDTVAFSAADGKELWRVRPGGPLRGGPTVGNGAVYVVSQDNQLFALSQVDGTTQWSQAGSLESQGVFGVSAPAVGRGTVVAGFSSGELNAYRYENGRTLWQDTLSRTSISTSVSSLADIDASPVIDQSRVYAVGEGGRMVALELTTGQRIWEQNFAGISTPWIAGEWLFVVTDDAKLVCLSRANGKIRWISELGAFKNLKKRKNPIFWLGPLLAGGRLIVLNSLGEIASVSPTTGEISDRMKGSGPFSLPPVVANNMLFVLDDKGRISAYR